MTKPADISAFSDYKPVPTNRRHDGWTADKQRQFLMTLSETGCVEHACRRVGMSAQSAYRFRMKPEADDFLTGWNDALRLATARLTALAFDRAINGVCEETIKDGKVVSSKRRYSDKLLMFLITHLDSVHYGALSALQIGGEVFDPITISRDRMHCLLETMEPNNPETPRDDGDPSAMDIDDPV